MESQLTELLKSPNPQDRKKAIRMLVQRGESDALLTLARLYKSETDPEIKDLALKAGRHLKKQQEANETVTEYPAAMSNIPKKASPTTNIKKSPVDDDEEDMVTEYPAVMSDIREATAPVKEPQKEFQPATVSAYKQAQAKGLMEQALDFSVRGYRGEAIEHLIKAFKINPNLRLDSYYMGVAMNITRLDQEDTLYLIDEDPKERKARLNAKAAKQIIRDDLRWKPILQNLGLAYLGIAVIAMLVVLIHASIKRAGLASVKPMLAAGCQACEYSRLAELVRYNEYFESFSVGSAMIQGLIIAAVLIALLLIYLSFIHLAARMMLNKAGTYRGVLHHGMLPLLIGYGVMLVILAVFAFLSVHESFNPNYLQLTQRKATFSTGTLPHLFLIVALGSAFGGTAYLSSAISKYYYISANQGQQITMRASFFFALLLIFGGLVFVFIAPLLG